MTTKSHQPDPAHARVADPDTSHDAAQVASEGITVKRYAVWYLLETLRAKITRVASCLTDDEIAASYAAYHVTYPRSFPAQSAAGLRSRRAELVEAGYVAWSGEKDRSAAGNPARTWGIDPDRNAPPVPRGWVAP